MSIDDHAREGHDESEKKKHAPHPTLKTRVLIPAHCRKRATLRAVKVLPRAGRPTMTMTVAEDLLFIGMSCSLSRACES